MDEEVFNQSIRKFLKTVGVGSQHEIERAVRQAIAAGAITGTETFPVSMTLHVDGLELDVTFGGELQLE